MFCKPVPGSPVASRGIVSGLLQEGYAVGYLIAAIVYWVVFPWAGWRGMFVVGVVPALLVLYIRRSVEESPVWRAQEHSSANMWRTIKEHGWLFVYVIVLMACFNAFSHGTQDLYPTFLKQQHGFSTGMVSTLTIIANLGAIAGGILFGAWSERIGRKRAITLAAIGALPIASSSSSISAASGAGSRLAAAGPTRMTPTATMPRRSNTTLPASNPSFPRKRESRKRRRCIAGSPLSLGTTDIYLTRSYKIAAWAQLLMSSRRRECQGSGILVLEI